jgi:hypothetical protein
MEAGPACKILANMSGGKTTQVFLDFKLSPCFECRMFASALGNNPKANIRNSGICVIHIPYYHHKPLDLHCV